MLPQSSGHKKKASNQGKRAEDVGQVENGR